jgi:hypothetical protein
MYIKHTYSFILSVQKKNVNITTAVFEFVVRFKNFMMLIHKLMYETGHAAGGVA